VAGYLQKQATAENQIVEAGERKVASSELSTIVALLKSNGSTTSACEDQEEPDQHTSLSEKAAL
jgi:hypothetical protein